MITSHSDRYTRQNYGYFSRVREGRLVASCSLLLGIGARSKWRSTAGRTSPTDRAEWQLFAQME